MGITLERPKEATIYDRITNAPILGKSITPTKTIIRGLWVPEHSHTNSWRDTARKWTAQT